MSYVLAQILYEIAMFINYCVCAYVLFIGIHVCRMVQAGVLS